MVPFAYSAPQSAEPQFLLVTALQKAQTVAVRTRAYFSLGSNLGDRAQNLTRAVSEISRSGSLVAQSSLYETEPVQVVAQPWFLNCAAALDTQLSVAELLSAALAIEKEMGRLRSQAKGARVIDIDILLYGDFVVETPDLIVPHPNMHERRFVLEPLLEIAPDATHPLLRKTIRQLLAELPPGQIVRKIAAS
jgi:2-amino-4-hydroxy-6-hydroxymethyldihydropteridine diphosphokinase